MKIKPIVFAQDVSEHRPLIDCRKLTKIFRRNGSSVNALTDVDLVVQKGDFLSVVGKNGSGKSTLLSILGAMARPTSGSVSWGDLDLSNAPESALTRIRATKAGYIFQDFNLLKRYTVFENIELAAMLCEPFARRRRERIFSLLKRLAVDHRANHYPSELSAGEQQKTAVARALVNNPAVIFADEPTAEVDPPSAHEITALLTELNEQDGITVVVATHGTFDYHISKRQCFLSEGRIVTHAV